MMLDSKLMESPPTRSEESSPTRRPRFKRSLNFEFHANRRHNLSVNSQSSKSVSIEEPNISIKFVKPLRHDGSSLHSPIRANKDEQRIGLLIESRIKGYKRDTTPLKSKDFKAETLSPLQKLVIQVKELNEALMCKEMEIAQLEDSNEKMRKRLLDREQMDTASQGLRQKCNRLEKELFEKHSKLSHLEDTLKESESSLSQTRSSLEKLRKEIADNRIQELEKERGLLREKVRILEGRVEFEHQEVQKMDGINATLQKQMEGLILDNQKLERQLYARSSVVGVLKEQSLTKQIQSLKEQLAHSHSEHQVYLEEVISSQRSEILKLNDVNKALYIKLDVSMKKLQHKNKENQKSKDKEFVELQSKYRKFLLEYKTFRQEHNEVLRKNLQNEKSQRSQRNRFERDDDTISLSYSLSPDKDTP